MLSKRSKQVRRDTIVLSKANGGYHYGGCFSAVEILITLFDAVLRPEDRFILSKGHGCWPYYVLLREKGFSPKLEGHPCRDVANGMAKKFKQESGRVYVLMGDGECQEGTTWESMLLAAHYKLDNLVVIVDRNQCQGSGRVHDILSLPALTYVVQTIPGWSAVNIDGHDVAALERELVAIHTCGPKLVVAETVKGKGVSFMEDKPEWHAKWLDDEHEKLAMEELSHEVS